MALPTVLGLGVKQSGSKTLCFLDQVINQVTRIFKVRTQQFLDELRILNTETSDDSVLWHLEMRSLTKLFSPIGVSWNILPLTNIQYSVK